MMLLSIRNAVKIFGGLRALDGVSLDVEEDTVTGLIGPNGSGKTTLFNIVSGFLPNDGGEIYFKGKRIDKLSPDAIARQGLIRTFQIDQSAVEMTVLENLLVSAPNQTGEKLWHLIPRIRKVLFEEKQNLEKATSILALLGFEHLANEYAGNLSGGQRKLLSLGRMLMAGPDMYMLDEPTAGMSPEETAVTLRLMKRLSGDLGLTILFCEHDMGMVFSIASQIMVMQQGKSIIQGPPEEVRNNQQVREAYLGGADQCST